MNIEHIEGPATSRLFNAFLLLALMWLAASALIPGFAGDTPNPESEN